MEVNCEAVTFHFKRQFWPLPSTGWIKKSTTFQLISQQSGYLCLENVNTMSESSIKCQHVHMASLIAFKPALVEKIMSFTGLVTCELDLPETRITAYAGKTH